MYILGIINIVTFTERTFYIAYTYADTHTSLLIIEIKIAND